jgi:integrase
MWFVRYRVTDAAGNDVMKRVSGFASEAEAWEQARALEQASSAGIDVNGDRKPVGYWVERWFSEHVLHATEQTTTARYNQAIEVLSTLPIWQEPVRNLSAYRYTQLLRFLLERVPGKRIAPTTATGYADPIRLALSWATKTGQLPRNPIVGYTSLSIPRTNHRILSDLDIKDLTTASKDKNIRIALFLGLYCGLRLEEVAGLTWDAVDLPRRTIRITEVRTRTTTGVEVIKVPKTDRSMRTVTLPDLVLQELKAAKRVHRRVCVTPEGQPYTLAAIRRAVVNVNLKVSQALK